MRPATSIAVLVSWLALAATAQADGIVFPKDAGVLNVKDLGAKGDGRHDDTSAIQKALDTDPKSRRVVYLPNGIYKVSDTLTWTSKSGTVLQGQSREKTVLRLIDSCGEFDNPKSPKSVIETRPSTSENCRNEIRDLTIESGKKNSGAIGLRFRSLDQGCIRNVTIRAGENKGAIGLDLAFADVNGPLLVKEVRVVGFDYGVRTARIANSLTIENLALQDQSRYGLVNEGACLSIRGLESRNTIPAIVNAGETGILTLIDAKMVTGRGTVPKPAVLNEAFLYARNILSTGYAEAIRNAANDLRPDPGSKVEEFVSHKRLGDPLTTSALAVKETPTVPWDDLKDWVSPGQFGAKPNDDKDDSEAIQKAIDSGKTTVYLPRGNYVVQRTILIRGKVRRLIGCEASLKPVGMSSEAVFKVSEAAATPIVIERLTGSDTSIPMIENASSRTVVVKDCDQFSGHVTGAGDLFLENVSSSPSGHWRFGKQKVWARQFHFQSAANPVVCDTTSLWILGFTAEGGGTLLETRGHGRTEIRGGLCRTTTDAKGKPMFLVDGGVLALTFGEACIRNSKPYDSLVKTPTRETRSSDVPRRVGSSALPFWSGSR